MCALSKIFFLGEDKEKPRNTCDHFFELPIESMKKYISSVSGSTDSSCLESFRMRFERDCIIGSPLKSILADFHAPKEPVHDKLEQQDQILILFILKYEDIYRKINH